MKKSSLYALRSATNTKQMRRDVEYNSPKYLINDLAVCRLLPPNHLISTE
jgi:hypothetical protein